MEAEEIKKELTTIGFKPTTTKTGITTLELPIIKKSLSIRTYGNFKNGEPFGVYFYNKKTDTYSDTVPLM